MRSAATRSSRCRRSARPLFPGADPAMSLGAVLFDLDGTLVDTLPVCYLAFRGALERAGAPTMTDGEIHALFGPSEEGMMQRVLPEDWERVLPAYFEEYQRLLASCPAIIPELGAALAL